MLNAIFNVILQKI